MRVGVVSNIMGSLLIFLGLTMLLPLVFSLFYGENIAPLLLSSGITMGCGLILRYYTAPVTELNQREGYAVATLGWVAATVFGSLPFIFSGAAPTIIDAIFESMSGFSTTGATILADIEAQSKGILFWRSFTHWLGGMGILVLSVAILPRLGAGGLQLFRAEVPGPVADRFLPRVAATSRALWLVYVGMTLLQTVLLFLGGMSLFDALTHAFATMGTGGYSTRSESIAAFNSVYLEGVIIIFMFLAGTNFSLHYQVLSGKPGCLWKDAEFRFYTLVSLGTTLLISFNLWQAYYDSFLTALRHSAFQVVSITTTTGFSTADFDKWPSFSRGLLLLLEFFGGCAGSTGGAVKQIRILVLLKYGYRELKRLIHPRAVVPLRLGDKTIPEQVIAGIVGFIFLYVTIFIIGVLVLTGFNIELVTAISAVAATLGNIGPGLNAVGPMENFLALPQGVKLFLSFLMLLGRLEIFTVLVLLVPDYIRGVQLFSDRQVSRPQ
ncbi:MAG TPA: TrkH family potassium uptake protein [Firmicutes bacterium]|nr:TrkH family potassium uptake protein [Bacillota bacterium]